MQPSHVVRFIAAKAAALGCALMLSLFSPALAATDGESADEAALRADARRIFKENVEPFVKTYCTKCHGGGRAKEEPAPGRLLDFRFRGVSSVRLWHANARLVQLQSLVAHRVLDAS